MFCFCCEMYVWMYGVKVCKDVLYVCVVRVKDEKHIIDMTEIFYDLMFLC